MCIRVGVDSDLGKHNNTYLKLYSSRNIDTSKLIRLSFRGNECYIHRGTNKFWEPKDVPFDALVSWFNEQSKIEPNLTNWQYAILMWNRESEFWISTDDFISGNSDKVYGKVRKNGSREFPRYIESTTPIPEWDAKTMKIK